jgi:chromosome segregation ATPase
MSTASKKPATPGGNLGRRPSTDPSLTSNTPARRSPTPSSTPSANGVARTRSIRGGTPVSARAAMQRAGAGTSNLSNNSTASETEDDSHAEAVALLDELKERLRASEINSDKFEKETEVLQSRLDEALLEQGKLEDRLHETEERLEIFESEKREMSRQMREMESIYEAERVAMTREKEDMANREEEMQTVVQRLKDSLSQRANLDDESRISRHCTCCIGLFYGVY